jgi:hypothetical protein
VSCDAREQDIEPLEVQAGVACVPLRSRFATVRLVS